MTDQLQAARALYFRHKERGLVGNPDPMLAAVLALGDGDRRDAERLRAFVRSGLTVLSMYGDEGPWVVVDRGVPISDDEYESLDAAVDAAVAATRPESV